MNTKKILASSILLALSTSAFAAVPSVDAIPDSKVEGKKSGFHGIVGLAAASVPEYVGSDETETTGLPLINVTYNDTYYFKFNRLGASWAVGDAGLKLGAELTVRKGWDAGDVETATGIPKNLLDDRDDIMLLGGVASYARDNWSAELGIYGGSADDIDVYDVNNQKHNVEPGGEVVARFNYSFVKNKKYSITGALKVEALSEDTVEYLYGESDSATNVTAAVVGTYTINEKWVAMAALAATSLDDTISDSAIAEDDTQTLGLIGVAYAF